MITDDHKEKKRASPRTAPLVPIDPSYIPGQGVFVQDPSQYPQGAQLQLSYSTPNLSGSFGFQGSEGFGVAKPEPYHSFQFSTPLPTPDNTYVQPNPHNHPNYPHGMPILPTNRSRQASPTGLTGGPQQKKRRASGSGRTLANSLMMTPVTPDLDMAGYNRFATRENVPESPTITRGLDMAGVNRFPTRGDVPEPIHTRRARNSRIQNGLRTNPPTPPTAAAIMAANRSQSMENMGQPIFRGSSSTLSIGAQSPTLGTYGNPSTDLQPHLQNTMASLPRSRPTSQHSNTSAAAQWALPQTYEVNITAIGPSHGSTHGGYGCVIVGSGFYEGLQVLFGGRPCAGVGIVSSHGLTCVVPPGEGPGVVAVTFFSTNNNRLPSLASPGRFTYTDEPQPHPNGLPLANNYTSDIGTDHPHSSFTVCDQNLQQQQQINSDYNTYQHNMQQGPQLQHHRSTSFGPYEQRHSHRSTSFGAYDQRHSRHLFQTPSPSETPPTYADVEAEDSRWKDLKTRSMLSAVGDVLAEKTAASMYDSTKVEASKPSTLSSTSTVRAHREDLSLVELKTEVKGLMDDMKLWWFWVSPPLHCI